VHVPKTSVDENYLATARKDKVGSPRQSAIVQDVPIAHSVNQPTNRLFRTGIFPANRSHVLAALYPCQNIRHRLSDHNDVRRSLTPTTIRQSLDNGTHYWRTHTVSKHFDLISSSTVTDLK
jgi:hypothetical protein